MPEAAAEEKKVELSQEEYERLLAATATKQTITVEASEYSQLVAQAAEAKKAVEERDRFAKRCRELEMVIKTERIDHQGELDAAMKHIKKLQGIPG